jgi:hypothetical protein
MNWLIKSIIVSVMLCSGAQAHQLAPACAVTYEPNGNSRFGDALFCYCKAKWFAKKHNMPLLYKPFSYSDQLMIDQNEMLYNQEQVQKDFKEIKVIRELATTPAKPTVPTLYVIRVSTRLDHQGKSFFDLDDPVFKEQLKAVVVPRGQLKPFEWSTNTITVAVHVRRGGGYDRPLLSLTSNGKKTGEYSDVRSPLRFPPDSFYIAQIKKVAAHFKKKPLYVHIFTDDQNPKAIVEKYRLALNNPLITFGCREDGNRHDAHVLEDFFAMIAADCLIRSRSHFSMCAEFLGNHQLIIYPTSFVWEENRLKIDSVGTNKRKIG